MSGVILSTHGARMRPVVIRLRTTMHRAASTRYEKRSAWLVQTSTRRKRTRLSAKKPAMSASGEMYRMYHAANSSISKLLGRYFLIEIDRPDSSGYFPQHPRDGS